MLESMMDKVVITPVVVLAWDSVCQRVIKSGVEIPEDADEHMEIMADGRLRIFVPGVPGAELTVHRDHWAWLQ